MEIYSFNDCQRLGSYQFQSKVSSQIEWEEIFRRRNLRLQKVATLRGRNDHGLEDSETVKVTIFESKEFVPNLKDDHWTRMRV